MGLLKRIPEDQTIVERIYGDDGSDNPKYLVTTESGTMFYFYEIIDGGFKLCGRHKNAAHLLAKYLK